jgi:hypothetical protein
MLKSSGRPSLVSSFSTCCFNETIMIMTTMTMILIKWIPNVWNPHFWQYASLQSFRMGELVPGNFIVQTLL